MTLAARLRGDQPVILSFLGSLIHQPDGRVRWTVGGQGWQESGTAPNGARARALAMAFLQERLAMAELDAFAPGPGVQR